MNHDTDRILYHASTLEIRCPLANVGRKELDFGSGFYLTSDMSQAEKWAETVASRKPGSNAVVNVYGFDEKGFEAHPFRKKIFTSYSLEWLDFISDSRKGGRPWAEYDWIEGGIANDRVISTVDAYVDGFITAEQALDKLVAEELRHQVCISKQEILDDYCLFIKSIQL